MYNTNENELISVIINVYNGEKFINKCLNSIINQTYKNLEILIINDGSTDNTLEICKSYKDERIRIINQENMGLSLSRNVGIDNARGEYLYFIDVDDFVTLDVIEYLYNIAKEKNVSISTCRSIQVHDYNYELQPCEENTEIISSRDMIKKILRRIDTSVSIWNKLIKKELLNNLRFENRIINDLAFTHKLVIKAEVIGYSNQIKYFYLTHPKSITAMDKNERTMDLYKAAIERYYYIKNIYPELVENELWMYHRIAMLYLFKNNRIRKFLKDEGAFKFYNKIYKFKNISKINFSSKVKFILFRINPKLCRIVIWGVRPISKAYHCSILALRKAFCHSELQTKTASENYWYL